MKNAKKIIIGVVVVALVAGGAAGGAVYLKSNNKETVGVVSVDSLASDYYMDDTTLDGNIVTNVTQNVTVDKDMIIKDLYVQKGDTVKKGDKLMSFDMTLVQMELNIAKLKKQKQEQDLEKAVNRLNSLKNGGPIEEEDSQLPDLPTDNSTSDTEMASAAGNVNGSYLAAIIRPILAAADVGLVTEDDFSSGDSDTGADQEDTGAQPDSGDQGVSGDDSFVDFGDGNQEQITPDPSVTPSPEPLTSDRMKNLQIPLQTMTLRSLIRNRTVMKVTLQTVNRSFIRSWMQIRFLLQEQVQRKILLYFSAAQPKEKSLPPEDF